MSKGSPIDVRAINVLVVDDEPHVCRVIEDILAGEEFHCTSAQSGREAMRLLPEGNFDVAILDMLMPDVSGMDLLEFILSRKLPTRVICMTGAATNHSANEVSQAGAFGFMVKPFEIPNMVESVRCAARSRCDIKDDPDGTHPANDGEEFPAPPAWVGSDKQLKRAMLESASALVRAVEAKDHYTRRHSDHVAHYSEQLARHFGIPADITESIRIAALLHDIGKIAIPDSILTKPGKLSGQEFALIRRHPDVGAAILENITMLRAEAGLVRHHHENWDGSGYPSGLKGRKIPLGSRILNIADSMDAMLMQRTYKHAYTVDQMLEELDRCAGKQFDPSLAPLASDWCRNNHSKLILPTKKAQSRTA